MSEDLRIRLLIVDDEQSIRQLCMTVGEALGFTCMEADSGESALALLEEQPAHIILTDMVMPNMSGLDISGKGEKDAAAHRGCGHDRPRIGGNRGPGHEAGRLRLHQQAVLSAGRTASVPAPHGGKSPPGGREPISARARGHRNRAARHRRRVRENPGRAAHDLALEGHAHAGADHGRKRHRQGAGGARHSLPRLLRQSAVCGGGLRIAGAHA